MTRTSLLALLMLGLMINSVSSLRVGSQHKAGTTSAVITPSVINPAAVTTTTTVIAPNTTVRSGVTA